MRDLYHSSHEYNLKCYLLPKKIYNKNSVLSADLNNAQIFYAKYNGALGKAGNTAAGTMQYVSNTFSIETLDVVEVALNDFVSIKGQIYVVETLSVYPIQHSQDFGKNSFSTVIELRR